MRKSSPLNKLFWIGLVLVFLSAGIVLVIKIQSRSSKSNTDVPADNSALRNDIHRSAAQARTSRDVSGVDADTATESDSVLSEEQIMEMLAVQKRYLAALQSQTDDVYGQMANAVYNELLKEEETDQRWQLTVSATLESFLMQPQFEGTKVDSVTCGEQICKLRVTHEGGNAASRFWKHALGGSMPWDTETYSNLERNEDGSSHTNLFFSKQAGDLDFHIRAREAMLQKKQ